MVYRVLSYACFAFVIKYIRGKYQCIDRSDVDYSLSPPPRSSVRATCARTQVTFGPATPAPAPVDRPMDTG